MLNSYGVAGSWGRVEAEADRAASGFRLVPGACWSNRKRGLCINLCEDGMFKLRLC